MTREEFLKTLMKNKYGSVKAFSEFAKLPYTTVHSILDRGVGNSSVDKIITIAKTLNIPIEILEDENNDFFSILESNYSEAINQTNRIMMDLTEENQNKVLTYAKERLILQEAEQ